MLDKKSYLDMKKYLKCLCRKNALQLCEDMQLTEYERDLLLSLCDNKSRIQTSMNLSISIGKYTTDMKNLMNKIYNYKNTQ